MKNKFLVIALCLFALIYSCTKDFIEKNISGETISILAPADNFNTSSTTVLFWWNLNSDIEKYNVQIVTPNFTTISRLIADTNVTSNKFSISLLPGTYQWRIRGVNNASSTAYVTRTLTIDSTSNLGTQTLVLVSPANNLITNQMTQTFRWDTLSKVTNYEFQIIKSPNTTPMVDVTLVKDTISYTLDEGVYTWQVRAQNALSNTLYSSRALTIDTTAPPPAVLLSPSYGDSIVIPGTLKWTRDASASGDSLFIYPDSLVSSAMYKGYFTATSYSFTGTAGSKYFWRMKSGDAAGNWSGFGTLSKFYVK